MSSHLDLLSRPLDLASRGLRASNGPASTAAFELRATAPSLDRWERSFGNQVEANREDWERLNAEREADCEVSDALAPAEHYAYSRYEVSQSGLPGALRMGALSAGYEAFKAIIPEQIQNELIKSGRCAPSPASLDALLQSIEGIIDGLQDYFDAQENANDAPEKDAPESIDFEPQQLMLNDDAFDDDTMIA